MKIQLKTHGSTKIKLKKIDELRNLILKVVNPQQIFSKRFFADIFELIR